ncbi:MAG: FmdB family zinc ribbon protein [Haloechinothrix sp.]
MPTYQYACKECDHEFEAVQSFTDTSLTDCPDCAGPLRKLFGSVGVIFKGSGFYRNDSRSGSKSSSTGAKPSADSTSSTTTSEGSTGSASSSEKKPAAAAASAPSTAKAS